MQYNLYMFIFGMIVGYVIMYLTLNIVILHGPNSNEIRNKYFYKNGHKYRFIPRVVEL
jgi:hypothetical protein